MSVSVRHVLSVWYRNASMYRRTWKLNLLPNFFEMLKYVLSKASIRVKSQQKFVIVGFIAKTH